MQKFLAASIALQGRRGSLAPLLERLLNFMFTQVLSFCSSSAMDLHCNNIAGAGDDDDDDSGDSKEEEDGRDGEQKSMLEVLLYYRSIPVFC